MKRRLLVFLSVLFALITTVALVTACGSDDNDNDEDPKVSGAEVGEYYCEYNGTEYSLTLSEGRTFTMTIAADTLTGEYTLDGEALALNAKSQSAIAATYRVTEITLTYQGTSYKFLKKVEFTVHFETGGGTAVTDQKVINGKTATKPADPTYGEKVFIGWYTDNNSFRNPYYFSQPITENITLYARFVDMINPEFEVTFDAGEGGSVALRTTVGHKLFELPTPERSDGVKFVGWYVSQFYDGDKLSYLYEAEMPIEEDITLYAMWDEGKPAFTVGTDGIRILNAGVNTRYTIAITAPGASEPETDSDTAAFYPYDFTSKDAGEYVISVTIDNETTTLYYKNKALARVTAFEVEESTILFNEVPHAERYLLTVVCGTAGHQHTEMEVQNRSWSFGNCEMPENGFVFTVKALANGYATSESEPFVYTRTLESVKNLTIDKTTETIKWDAVEKATSYFVTIKKAGTEAAVFAQDIGDKTSIDFKNYAEGNYTIEVKALARGWKTSAAATITYQKDRLATPTSLRFTGEALTWDAVPGAEKYIVTIGGTEYTVEGKCTLSLAGLDINTEAGPVEVTIRAAAANKTDSVESEAIVLRAELGELAYEAGRLTWEAVIGIEEYVVTVNDNAPVTVQNNAYNVTFDREGVNTLKVSILNASGETVSEKTTTVTAYKISFVAGIDSYTAEIPSKYFADGDPIVLPELEFYGYTFEAWYTAPGGAAGEGERYSDSFFRDGQNRTLYGAWYGNEHTITFVIGRYGMEAVASKTVRFGETTTLPVAVSSVDTYAFSGWHYDSDSGLALTDFKGEMIRPFLTDADVTLYASYVEVFEFKEEGNVWIVSKGPGITQGIVTEVRIPERYQGKRVDRISDFSNCPKLEVINIPDSISTILLGDTNAAFAGDTALRAITVYKASGEVEPKWFSSGGVLFSIDEATSMRMLSYFPLAKVGEYTIPEGVLAIRSGAINGIKGLTKLIISNTVTEIQQYAIVSCAGLTSVEFQTGGSASALDLRPGAFQDCAALTEIKLPARLSGFDPDSLAGLAALKTISIEEGGDYTIVDGLLCKINGDGSVSGKEAVFAPKGMELGDYTIPSGIVSIGARAFYEHPSLTGITIPAWVEKIGTQAFGHITVLASITFKGVKSDYDLRIEEKAFYAGYLSKSASTGTSTDTGSNTLVTTLHLPANLVFLGAHAFGRYTKLTEVWVDTDRDEIEYTDRAFLSAYGLTASGEQGTTSSLSYVTTVHIGAGCPAFSFAGVFGNKLAEVEIDPNNEHLMTDDGVVYNKAGTQLVYFPIEKGGEYTILDGVEAIDANTFSGREQLTGITIPASVASIGDKAFYQCRALERVTFLDAKDGQAAAENLTIGNEAFYSCNVLEDITLPKHLTSIGYSAFKYCRALPSIELPAKLSYIEIKPDSFGSYYDVFDGCYSLKSLTIAEGNVDFKAIDGVIYKMREVQDAVNGEERVPFEAIYTSPGATGTVTVPGTVHVFNRYAIKYIPNVTKIVFQDVVPVTLKDGTAYDATNVTYSEYALYGGGNDEEGNTQYNQSLEEIVFPEGLTTIGTKPTGTSQSQMSVRAFISSFNALSKITIPSTVTTIYAGAFSCPALSQVTFAKTKEGADPVPLTFEDCGYFSESFGASYFTIFGTCYSSGSTTPFLPNFTSLEIPARTVKIGDYAFYQLPATSVTFEEGIGNFTIGKSAFSNMSKVEAMELPEGLTEIGDSAFSSSKISSSKLPDSVTKIGRSAFNNTTFLDNSETLVLPESLVSVDYSAFGTTTSPFVTVDFSKAKNLQLIGDHAFYNMKKLTTITFAEATDESPDLEIGLYAFSSDPLLDNVTLPANLTRLGMKPEGSTTSGTGNVFYDDKNLKSITFATFTSGNNVGKSRLEFIGTQSFRKAAITNFTFPESTADTIELEKQIFQYCRNLTNVHLSKSVSSIDNVFQGCGSLEKITIAQGSQYFKADEIQPILFDASGTAIQFVYKALDEGVFEIQGGTSIGAGAFYGQTEITKVIIPASVQRIGASAFANCVSLQTVEFKPGSGLTEIGEMAFQYCYSLENINLEACTYLQTLGTFHAATGTPGVSGYKKEYYGGNIFEDDMKLTGSFKLPASLEAVGQYAFGYSGITGLDFSACTQLTDLEDYSLARITLLTDIKFPTSLEFIGIYGFAYDAALETIDLSNTQVTRFTDVKGADPVKMSNGKESTSGSYTALYTFRDCTNLQTLKLPAGFMTFGYQEFYNDLKLATITIGDGEANDLSAALKFYPGAFYQCGIPSVKIPGNVTYDTKYGSSTSYIKGTFEACENLVSVEFTSPASLTTIPQEMFIDCSSLASVNFTALTGLTKIDKGAFANCGFTEVDLSMCTANASLLTAAGNGTSSSSVPGIFQGCASLSSIKLPAQVKQLGAYMLYGTGFTTLDLAEFKQITSWGTYMFAGCVNLASVNIPKTLGGNPGNYMFQDCTSLETVTFEDGYNKTLSQYMFKGCTALGTIDFSKTKITTLGANAFQDCTSLKNIDLSTSTATSLGNYMFDGCSNLASVTVPSTLTCAGTYTFRNCTSLQSIDLSETKITRFASTATGNVTASLAVHTFDGCENLATVLLPEDGIVQIGGYTFLNCKSLKNIDLSKVIKFGKQAFMGSGLTGEITLSDKIDTFGDQVFADCPNITAFTGADSGTAYKTQSSMIVNAKDGTIIAVPGNISVSGATLELTGDSPIGSYAFYGFAAQGVTTLDLSEMTITSIPNYAFYGSPFEEIILPDTVTTLGTYVFAECANLKTVHLSNVLTTIGNYAFQNDANLLSVALPETLTSLGTYVFQNCAKLTGIEIPEGVATIPNYTFDGNTALTTYEIPEHITAIGQYAFRNTSLTSITIPEKITKIDNYAFTESAVASVVFQGNPGTFGTNVFKDCANLKTIDFGPCTTIGGSEFIGSGLESITVPETITSIGNNAFQNCLSLTSATVNATLTTVGSSMFAGCTALTTVQLSETFPSISGSMFKGCEALEEINLPESLTGIGSSAFEGCIGLTGSIVIPDTITLGGSAFKGCTGLTSIEVSAAVLPTSSTGNVFSGWTKNQKILIRNSRFEVCSILGMGWVDSVEAEIVYNYDPESANG